MHFSDFRVLCFRKFDRDTGYIFRSRARARQPVGVASGRATRPRPRSLRGIPRMQALVLALPPAPAWRPPGSLEALSVVIRTIWVKSNRLGGPGRRLKNILCGLRCDPYSRAKNNCFYLLSNLFTLSQHIVAAAPQSPSGGAALQENPYAVKFSSLAKVGRYHSF